MRRRTNRKEVSISHIWVGRCVFGSGGGISVAASPLRNFSNLGNVESTSIQSRMLSILNRTLIDVNNDDSFATVSRQRSRTFNVL